MSHRRVISRADLEATFSRSGPMPPNPPPRATNHEFYEQQMRERQNMEMAKRRSQRPTDRDLPEGLDNLIPLDDAKNYQDLRDIERQLDAVMMRKRLDIQDTFQTSQPRQGTLRLWISNTVENQPWQQQNNVMDPEAFDFSSNVEPVFRVKIEGKIIEDEEDVRAKSSSATLTDPKSGMDDSGEDGEPAPKKPRLSPSSSNKKLSNCFKIIEIEFDRAASLQPDNYTSIVWDKSKLSATADQRATDFDCLEFTRKGDENIHVTINLTREEPNPTFQLEPPLAEILGTERADKKTVLMGLWEYIKYNKLLMEGGDGRMIQCDQRLKEVGGFPVCIFEKQLTLLQALRLESNNLHFSDLANKASAVMYDAPPIQVEYTIRVDKDFHSGDKPAPATIYDIPIPIETSTKDQIAVLPNLRPQTQTLQQIADLDDKLVVLIQKINQAKAKHGFFTSMSKDPANFIKRWISSQKRDLDVIMGSGAWGEEDWQGAEWRKGGLGGPWGTDEAWEGVGSFLTKQDNSNARPRPQV